jgi:glycosyltransferase involved in cell wall biosynthesis
MTRRAAADGAPLRILLVGNFLSRRLGTSGVCEQLAAQLEAAGCDILTSSDKPGRSARILDMVRTVWRRRRDFDVAHVDVFSGSAFLWAEAACGAAEAVNKPYVLTLHGGALPEFAARWPRRVSRLLTRAAAVTAPSRYLQERMAPYAPGLRLIPNPLHADQFHFRARVRPASRLVWLRAFHEIYNPALAPQVLARLRRRFPDARLTMIGPDKGDGSLQRTQRVARAEGIADRVAFPGAIDRLDVPQWLDRGDLFLNTTDVDNTPLSVLEALASGLPVVSTNAGGLSFLLENGHDALLVPSRDPDAMARALERALTEDGLAARLSENGRAKALSFDWSRLLPIWRALFQDVAARRIRCDARTAVSH